MKSNEKEVAEIRNKDYWKKRMAALEDEQHRHSMDYYKDVQDQFRRASNSIQMDIERWYQRLADNNGISYAAAKRLLKKNELEEFHWTVEQYIKAGEENAVDQRWLKELENASARHHISYLEAMKLQARQHAELLSAEFEGGMTDFLHKSYADGYYKTAFEISKGTGVGVNLVRLDDRRIDTVIKKPWARDGSNFSDRIWTNKKKLVNSLHTELTQSIIRGDPPQKAIESLAKTMNVSKAQAGRLIMTESAAVSSAAARDSYKELGVEKYEILATLDSLTSEICRDLDGKVFDLKNYAVGDTAPPFHPHCRTTTVPYFDDEFSAVEKRAARDEEAGDTIYVDGTLNYREWEKEYRTEAKGGDDKTKNYLKLPDEIMDINGMTEDNRIRIEKAITMMQKKYNIQLNEVSVESFGKSEERTLFIAGPYIENGKLKMGLAINRDIDYNVIETVIQKRYKSGYFASRTLEDCIAHEMAHAMTFQGCETLEEYHALWNEIPYIPGISGYADKCKSGAESLAEAFVKMQNGEKVPLKARVLVNKYIERWKR